MGTRVYSLAKQLGLETKQMVAICQELGLPVKSGLNSLDDDACAQVTQHVEDAGAQTEIRAKVWADGADEPAEWQVQAYDANSSRLTSGTVGLWSMGAGEKYWDELGTTTGQ